MKLLSVFWDDSTPLLKIDFGNAGKGSSDRVQGEFEHKQNL